jgi:hypothetical protein
MTSVYMAVILTRSSLKVIKLLQGFDIAAHSVNIICSYTNYENMPSDSNSLAAEH